MKEWSALTKQLMAAVKAAAPGLTVIKGFPDEKRPVPQREAMAAVSIQKAEISGFGLGDMGAGRAKIKKTDVEFRVTLCVPGTGADCLDLFEQVASGLVFGSAFPVSRLECGEPKASRDWGGIILPVKIKCSFGIAADPGTGQGGFRDVVVSAVPHLQTAGELDARQLETPEISEGVGLVDEKNIPSWGLLGV